MPPFEVNPFDEGDLTGFVPQPAQAGEYRWVKDVDWKRYRESGFAWTGWLDGEAICVGGINQILPGVGECWIVLSDRVHHRELLYLVRCFRRILQSELKTAYHRVQMMVDDEFLPGIRLAKIMGMYREGILRDYPLKGKTSYLYART